jgi:HD-GYP domain-containing protein (c-di-GMP phosphodiesterase class II)
VKQPGEWEALAQTAVAELAAGATAVRLYGSSHPRAVMAVGRLASHLEKMLAMEPDVSLVLLGDELFVQGRPFTRLSPTAPVIARRFRLRGVEHAIFRPGVTDDELRLFLEDLAATGDKAVESHSHILVGKVELAERELGGPDQVHTGMGRHKLSTIRDRVSLIQECFDDFVKGNPLAVGDLQVVARTLLEGLGTQPNPLCNLAPWEGDERWHPVHAHNVAAITVGLARLSGADVAACLDLGVAALVHDIGKLLFPRDVMLREAELAGEEIELILDHPKVGLDKLLAYPQVPPLALIAVTEHHLHFNGTGYPRLRKPRRPHPAARLLCVADTFDQLHTYRAAQRPVDRDTIVAWMDARKGTVLDPGWVTALRELISHRDRTTDTSQPPPTPPA